MKRLFRVSIFAIAILALLLPLTAATAEAPAYQEGITLQFHDGWSWHYSMMDIHATKSVDGGYRSSTVALRFSGPAPHYGRSEINAVFTVPIDADYLEISEDLGWGGLDAVVWVEQRTSWFTGPLAGRSETRMVPVVIHVGLLYTTNEVVYYDGFFYRAADVRGTMSIDGRLINFDLPNYGTRYDAGHNFADHWPGF